MRIKQILSQHRRDFRAVFVCPFCGHEEERSGYDDANFHENVVPALKCEKCGKTEKSEDKMYRPLMPKYPEGIDV